MLAKKFAIFGGDEVINNGIRTISQLLGNAFKQRFVQRPKGEKRRAKLGANTIEMGGRTKIKAVILSR